MRIARIMWQGSPRYGILRDGGVYALDGDVYGEYREGDWLCPIQDARPLAPVLPSKVVAVGLNYREHAQEVEAKLPEEPIIFIKPSTAILDPEGMIIYPAMAGRVDPEGELAVVIKKTAKHIEESDAANYILGLTCGNDVTARDLQRKDGQWTRGKSFDTFCPLGPVIATGLDSANLALETRVNGETIQQSNTSYLIFSVPHLISFISKVMTLLPGDVVLTGTPSGIRGVRVGDVVEVEIEGIGVLRNKVG